MHPDIRRNFLMVLHKQCQPGYHAVKIIIQWQL